MRRRERQRSRRRVRFCRPKLSNQQPLRHYRLARRGRCCRRELIPTGRQRVNRAQRLYGTNASVIGVDGAELEMSDFRWPSAATLRFI